MKNDMKIALVCVLVTAAVLAVPLVTVFAAPSKAPLPWAIPQQLTVRGPTWFDGPVSYGVLRASEPLGNSFSLSVDAAFHNVTATTAVMSSTATAITDGTYTWQRVLLRNGGSYNITVSDSANTDLGGANVTLGPADYLDLLWTGTDWERVSNTDN